MEISKFIQLVLEEMQSVKGSRYKKRYLVEEVELELSLKVSSDQKIGINIFGAGGKLGSDQESTQKVIIKLKPKNSQNEKISIDI